MDKKKNAKLKQARDIYEQITEITDESIYVKLSELERLYRGNNDDDSLAYVYAEALLNVAFKEVVDASALTVQKLMRLLARHSSNEDIAVCLGAALADLSEKQRPEVADKTRDQLESLCQSYPNNDELWAIYADTLAFDSDYNEDLINYAEDELLEDIHRIDPRRPKPTADEAFLRRMTEKTYSLEGKELAQHIAELEALYLASPEHVSLCATYAEALLARADEERGLALAKTVALVESLLVRHPSSVAIAIECGKGFVLQSIREDVRGTVDAAHGLLGLRERFPYSDGILDLYLMGLVNVALKEAEFGLERVLSTMRNLYEDEDCDGVITAYARVQCIWAMKQNVTKAMTVLEPLKEFAEWEPGDDYELVYHEFARLMCFALVLASVVVRMGSTHKGRKHFITLCDAACADGDADTLVLLWADTMLILLCNQQGFEGTWQTLSSELDALLANHSSTHSHHHDPFQEHEPERSDAPMMPPWEHLRMHISHEHPHDEILDMAHVHTEPSAKPWFFSQDEFDKIEQTIKQARRMYSGNRGLEWRCSAIEKLMDRLLQEE